MCPVDKMDATTKKELLDQTSVIDGSRHVESGWNPVNLRCNLTAAGSLQAQPTLICSEIKSSVLKASADGQRIATSK